MSNSSPGQRLRDALELERPLQVAGTISAYAAMLAARAGFRAIYLSGAGVANSAFGLPDLGVTTLNDVTEEVRRITAACELPLLVDADTGFGGAFSIARTCHELARAGAYAETGADMIFAEAITTLAEYRQFTAAVSVPVLANITEFGRTPLFTAPELGAAGVRLVLYPLSAFRAMSRAAQEVYSSIRADGTQRAQIARMQTREELYAVLDYHAYEAQLDRLFGADPDKE
jgi:methylisocitrate lyase